MVPFNWTLTKVISLCRSCVFLLNTKEQNIKRVFALCIKPLKRWGQRAQEIYLCVSECVRCVRACVTNREKRSWARVSGSLCETGSVCPCACVIWFVLSFFFPHLLFDFTVRRFEQLLLFRCRNDQTSGNVQKRCEEKCRIRISLPMRFISKCEDCLQGRLGRWSVASSCWFDVEYSKLNIIRDLSVIHLFP